MFTKKYLQDRPILFLNLFLVAVTVLTVISSFISVDTTKQLAITRYYLPEGLDGFTKSDNIYDLYSFAVAAVLFTALAVILSTKLYKQKRIMSLLLLGLTGIILVFNFVVSLAIFNLQ